MRKTSAKSGRHISLAGHSEKPPQNEVDEAIEILESRSDIQIVFTDIHMPGSIDGLKLAHVIRDRWPPIKLIVASGHMIVAESALPTGGRFFSKPYQSSDSSCAA